MAYAQVANEYRKNAVNTASPLQLVIMLYDGAIRFMEQGKIAMAARQLDKQNESLQRAQKIIFELMSCLDMTKGGEIAQNLFSLYTYVVNELVEANIKDEPEGIDRSMKILRELRVSWAAVEKEHAQPAQLAA